MHKECHCDGKKILVKLDDEKCEACEMCVKRAGNAFEIVDKDGKIMATFTGKFSKEVVASQKNCPKNAITIEFKD